MTESHPRAQHHRKRIFIFFPTLNGRMWRVLSAVDRAEFPSKGGAVEFALLQARRSGGEKLVEVYMETQSGGWMPVPAA